MRALVTGATGCVGANIVEALSERGYVVRALRRPTSRLDALAGLTPELVTGDVLDQASLVRAMVGCQLVFHAAAVSQYWRSSLQSLYKVNVLGTRNVLQAARSAGVERVVLTSSVAVLGVPTGQRRMLDEHAPYNCNPRHFHYAHSKFLAEVEAARSVALGQDVVCVNPATVIGRRDINFVGGEILRLARRGLLLVAPPGGMGVVSARVVGLGHVLAAERGGTGERYILNGENIRHRDLLRIVASVVGGRPPLVVVPKIMVRVITAFVFFGLDTLGRPIPPILTQLDLGARDMYFDGSKAERVLGLPRVGARAAVVEAWDWYHRYGLL